MDTGIYGRMYRTRAPKYARSHLRKIPRTLVAARRKRRQGPDSGLSWQEKAALREARQGEGG